MSRSGTHLVPVIVAILASAVLSPVVNADLLWDNNLEIDLECPVCPGARAVSPPVFPDIRVVDDFVVPDGKVWRVRRYFYSVIEDSGWQHGGLTEVYVYSATDDPDNPVGALFAEAIVPHEREFTGRQYFGRDFYHYYTLGDLNVTLPAGDYWVGMRHPEGAGAGTAYWVGANGGRDGMGSSNPWFSLNAGETWIESFDSEHHAFQIHGRVIPAPCGLALLGGAILVTRRRQRQR